MGFGLWKLFWLLSEMGGLNEKPTFFSFIFTPWNHIKIFYKIKIAQFSGITTEWPYPKKPCWKRLSDFNKNKFYQHLYHWKRKRLNKNKTWLILGNKCEIYLFTKEMKKKRIQLIWHLESFHIIEWFQIGRKVNTWCLKFINFSSQKILFVVKLTN